MVKVQLNIPPSLAGIFVGRGSDWFILEKEMREEATIGDLLADLAFSYSDFRKAVFNPEIGQVSDRVNVILNNNVLQFSHEKEAKLRDGDVVILVPVYDGG